MNDPVAELIQLMRLSSTAKVRQGLTVLYEKDRKLFNELREFFGSTIRESQAEGWPEPV